MTIPHIEAGADIALARRAIARAIRSCKAAMAAAEEQGAVEETDHWRTEMQRWTEVQATMRKA